MKVSPNPFGVTDYPDVFNGPVPTGPDIVGAAWPWSSSQCHWKNSGPTPNPDGPIFDGLRHTHVEGWFPHRAKLGAGLVTVPIAIKLFKTAGQVNFVVGEFMGPQGAIPFTSVTMDQPFPLRGDPNGVVTFTGHATFDPSLATATIPLHGAFNTRIWTRTEYDDHSSATTEHWVDYYSILDPTKPEPGVGEGFMEFAAKVEAVSPDNESGAYGNQLTEFRGTESIARAWVPNLVPFNTPYTVFPLTYNYKAIPASFRSFYELRLDPDFHMGIPGTVLASTSTELPNGGVSNVDVLDPTIIAASTPPMGATPGTHRLAFLWLIDTKAGGFGYGPNQRLVSIMVIEVKIGPNPIPVPPTTIKVPNIVGMTQADAAGQLSAVGLLLGAVTPTASASVHTGNVIDQNPAADALVPPLTAVAVDLSTGLVSPPAVGKWVTVGTPAFMQWQNPDGTKADRWKICDPDEPMTDGSNCPEIATVPPVVK